MQFTLKFLFIILFSKAERATIGFIVDPGEYKPVKVLLTNGFNGLFLINCQSSWLIPNKNKFGSNVGEDYIAIISPV